MGMCGSSLQGPDESGGLKLDGWIMGMKVGKGATGKVFLAKNRKTGKRVVDLVENILLERVNFIIRTPTQVN